MDQRRYQLSHEPPVKMDWIEFQRLSTGKKPDRIKSQYQEYLRTYEDDYREWKRYMHTLQGGKTGRIGPPPVSRKILHDRLENMKRTLTVLRNELAEIKDINTQFIRFTEEDG